MTHEEAIESVLGLFAFEGIGTSEDEIKLAIAYYLKARNAVLCDAEPEAWVREGFFEELHKDGSHSGIQTVLWLEEVCPGKRHSKRIPIFAALSDNPKGETP